MKNLPWILVGVLALALVLTWCSDGAGNRGKGEGGDTIWLPVRVDTIRDTVISPPVSEKPIGTDTARLPVQKPDRPKPSPMPGENPEYADSIPANISKDTLANEGDVIPDSVDVLIPIVEREYRTSDYRIVVSGYNPQLKYVELYQRTETGIVNPPAQKRKRWGFGPCISWGIGPNGKTQFILGASIHYDLLQW